MCAPHTETHVHKHTRQMTTVGGENWEEVTTQLAAFARLWGELTESLKVNKNEFKDTQMINIQLNQVTPKVQVYLRNKMYNLIATQVPIKKSIM